jgi:hypothetical protein
MSPTFTSASTGMTTLRMFLFFFWSLTVEKTVPVTLTPPSMSETVNVPFS